MPCVTSAGLAIALLCGCTVVYVVAEVNATGGPEITGIDGTGEAQAPEPRAEDATAIDQIAEPDRVLASRRITSAERELVITGSGLADATAVWAEGQDAQGRINFEIQSGGDETMLRVRFPATLAVLRGGLFLLSVVTLQGQAQAQVFFLQGQDGSSPCDCADITGDVTITGNLTVTEGLTVEGSIVLPDCPSGYAQDSAATDHVLCVDAASGDEMVRVGDFWIDKYEVSVWETPTCGGQQYGAGADDYASTFPDSGNWSTPAYACSVSDVPPSGSMTWYQAQASCTLAGKRLCSNAQWQAAVQGTHDPVDGLPSQATHCHIDSTNLTPRLTGQAGGTAGGSSDCISLWGAEDLIGNVSEWTAMWQGHPGWNGLANVLATGWDGDGYYGGGPSATDMLDRVASGSWRPHSPNIAGFGDTQGESFGPAASLRGGYWKSGVEAGDNSLSLTYGPAASNPNHGARCCRSY